MARGDFGGAVRLVIFGPDRAELTTLASCLPDPLIVDLTGEAWQVGCERTAQPRTYSELVDVIGGQTRRPAHTVVVDGWDEVERLCSAAASAQGLTSAHPLAKRCTDLLDDLARTGVPVVILGGERQAREMAADGTVRERAAIGCRERSLLMGWSDGWLRFAQDRDEHGGYTGDFTIWCAPDASTDAENRLGLPDCIPLEDMERWEGFCGLFRTGSGTGSGTESEISSAGQAADAEPSEEAPVPTIETCETGGWVVGSMRAEPGTESGDGAL